MDKVCRYCRYFSNGECIKGNITHSPSVSSLTQASENGELYETISEGFTEYDFSNLKEELAESRLSKKAVTELLRTFAIELEQAQMEWGNEIDQAIVIRFGKVDDKAPLLIKNPSEFGCVYWE